MWRCPVDDFQEHMTLEEYLAVMDKRGPKTAVSVGRKRKRRSKKKIFPPPLTPPVTVTKTIPMPAFGKARPRVTKGGSHTHMPDAYTNRIDKLRWAFGSVPAGLVHVSVTAVRQVPKSWSQKKQGAAIGRYAKPKPDADNILGAVLDALFEDDDRVISVFCEKVWGEDHALVIEVAPAKQEE